MAATSKTLELWKTLVESSVPDDVFEFDDSYRCDGADQIFELVWKKSGATDNGVTDIRLRFKFDYSSFALVYESMYPDKPIKDYDVAWTIGYFFDNIGHKVLIFGREYYQELATLICDTRGFRALKEFGI